MYLSHTSGVRKKNSTDTHSRYTLSLTYTTHTTVPPSLPPSISLSPYWSVGRRSYVGMARVHAQSQKPPNSEGLEL